MPLDTNHENYTTYEELDQYIKEFQAGETESGMKIINSFEGFITDYALLVHKGVFDINDPKMRDFVRLFMKDGRKFVNAYRHRPKVRADLYRTASKIHEIFSVLNYEEIYQELVLSLLQLAKRYRIIEGKPRFHVYAIRTYHYEARRRLQNLFYYESKRTIKNLAIDQGEADYALEEEWSRDLFNDSDIIALSQTTSIEQEEEIDEEWVLGWRASDYFSELTVLERRIMKLYYWNGNSDQQIADELGMCRVTINRYRLRAKGKVAEKCKGFNLFEDEKE